MGDFSLEDVFGSGETPTPLKGAEKSLSVDDVFGAQLQTVQPAATPSSSSLSVSEVFNAPPPDQLATPSILTYGKEFGKGIPEGALNLGGLALQGMAAGSSEFNQKIRDQIDRIDRGETLNLGEDITGYSQMNPEQRARVKSSMAETIRPVGEEPLYKAGTAVSKFGHDLLPPGPGFEGSLTRDIGSGVGSVGGAIVASILSPTAASLMFIQSGKGEAVDNAVKAGATNEQIQLAAKFGTVAGATDVVDALLPMLGSTGKGLGFIKRVGSAAIKGALAEGGQEGLQQFIQNLIAKGIYDPNKDLMDDVPRSVLIGAIVGGPTTALFHGGGHGAKEMAGSAETNAAYTTLVTKATPTGPDSSVISDVPPAPQQAPQSPLIPTPDTSNAAVTGKADDVVAQPTSAIEQLLQQPPATPTEAFIRERAPLSGGANDVVAAAAPALGADNSGRQLTKTRLEMIPEEQYSAEDDLVASFEAQNGVRASITQGEKGDSLEERLVHIKEEIRKKRESGMTDQEIIDSSIRKPRPGEEGFKDNPPRASITQTGDYPQGYHEAVPIEQRTATKGVSHPGYRWEVYDPINPSKVLSVHESAPQVRRAIDRRDNKYGAYKYKTRRRTATTGELTELESKFLHNSGFHSQIIGIDPNAKYNISKLTPLAALEREALEKETVQLLRQLNAQNNRQLVIAAVRQVAGPEAAGRVATPNKIALPGRNIPGWGEVGEDTQSQGFYSPRAEREVTWPLIAIAVATRTRIAITTAFHEGWHAIEGTLTSEEVEILRSETKALRTFLMEANPKDMDLYANAEPEEIWAEAAAFYTYDRTVAEAVLRRSKVLQVLQKIKEIIDTLRERIARHGFTKSADIFESFYRGEMAERRAALPHDMLERWWAREAGYEQELLDNSEKLAKNTDRNESALRGVDPGITKAPAQLETLVLHDAVGKLFAMTHGTNTVPPGVQQALAHADVMAKRHKWMWGLDRLVDLNPRFSPLLHYAELIRLMRTEATKIHDTAQSIAKSWRRLGKQSDALGQLLDHITNMNYRTPQEVTRGVSRNPTAAEFGAAVTQFRVGNAALKVFRQQKQFFQNFLGMITQNAIDEANRTISDPVARMNKIVAIQTKEAQLLSRPYFPFMRFGLHYVHIKDANGDTLRFETFERKGLRSAESVQAAAEKFYKGKLGPGETISHGVLNESAAPFIGLPPELLESIQRDLSAMPAQGGQSPGLTQAQINAIEQLRYAASPAASFAHRFQNKDYVPGYSDDFLRAFSRYAFQGGRYYSRVKYGWELRKQIADAFRLGKGASDNKIGSIANYMEDHLYNTVLDSKGDFGFLKGAIFHWTFGGSVAGATLNLMQVPFISQNWLAARYGGVAIGDARAAKALLKAGTQLQNFYKKGSYAGQTAFALRALDYGVKTGRISESQASELAGLAQGSTLLGLGNNKVRRGLQQLSEMGSWMFEMAEQYNRRVTFRAALELAQQLPNSKGVSEAMNKYSSEYAQMVQSGWNPAEARSVIAAVHATEQTQFVYARENRPRFMRGRLAGTILVFKNYLLNVLQLMGANKSSVMPRQLIMLLALGGLMGLPGAEDFEDIITLIGKWMSGKDFDVYRQLRAWLVDMVGDKADVVLHGLARRGFGLPALIDILGEKPSRGLGSGPAANLPIPVLDRSKAVSMGRILPIEIGSLLDPDDVNKEISQQTQNAAGAALGVGFNLYRALMDQSTGWTDVKRWEKAMPRALAAASRGYRAYTEERVRGKGGPNSAPTVVPFDPRDTEQVTEAIAMALGYTPLRVSAAWDAIIAKQEIETKLKIEQSLVLQNHFEAQQGGRAEEIDRANQAVRDFNDQLPDWGRGYKISAETPYKSIEARAYDKALKEAGVSSQSRNRPVDDYVRSLFPESVVDARKVR